MALYDKIGPAYIEGQKQFQSSREAWGISFIRRHLPIRHKTLLELGCGAGLDMETFFDEGAHRIDGMDNSEYMIGEAQKRMTSRFGEIDEIHRILNGPWTVERKSFTELNCQEIYHGVFSRFALHYEPNLDPVYEKVHQALNRNGVLAFAVPHPLHDFVQNDKGAYGVQKDITVPLYGGAVSVTYPTHTFADWLSPAFNKLFELIEIEEFHENHVQQSGLPTGLCIAGRKR